MALDGFSMANLGMPKDITSAQALASTEQQMAENGGKIVNKIDRALNKKINNEEEKQHKRQYFEDGFKEKKDDEEDDEENSEKESLEEENLEQKKENNSKLNSKDLVVRYNNINDKIELYNKNTKKTEETIKPKDFVEMITKLDYNSGILLDKSI
ncbi:hypothetical protein IJG72_04610 [bacterium]|nr:hypothetical protein [bacterium]